MKTLSYIMLYGFLATCGLATGQEITTQSGATDRVMYGAQHRELLGEWLRLAYGLQNNPDQHFERFAASGLPPKQINKTWFTLGKAFYLRGEYSAAHQALQHIKGKLPEDIKQDVPLLLAQTLMAQGAYQRAATVLESQTSRRTDSPYALYNLGIAQLRSRQQSQGIEALEEVGNMPADTAEMQALRDQANITLGYLYLEKRKTAAARQALQRASLNGPYASKALLALGWVEWQARNPRLAQTAWVELLNGDVANPVTQEALSGVPQALWRLESHTQARKKFDTAIAAYQEQLDKLDKVIAQTRDKAWLSDVFMDIGPDDLNPRNVWQKMDNTPLSPYLRELSASPPAQHALQKQLDLLRLASLLAHPPRLNAEIENRLGITMGPTYRNTLPADLQRLQQQLPPLQALQQERLQKRVMVVLEQQRERLREYLVNAQYALARLLDELAGKNS